MKRRFEPRRGGHAPGHLRAAFEELLQDILATDASQPVPATILIDDKPESAARILGQLWNCTDCMPSGMRSDIAGLFGVSSKPFTYAQGVRCLKDLFYRNVQTA